MSKIIVAKLVSGEEIIGKAIEVTSNELRISSPRTLVLQDAGGGRFGASFMPLLILGKDENVVIPWTGIVAYTYDVSKESEDRYLEQVSGLALATSLSGM